MDNPFSWDYLTTVPQTDEVFGPFAVIFLVLFGIGFLGSVFFYNDGGRRYISHPLKRRTIRRGSGIAMVVFGIGLFFFGIRVLQINPLNFGMRIWLWLSFLAVIVMFAYFAYYLRTVYRVQLEEYEERQRKMGYLRPAAATAGGPGRGQVPRGAPVEGRRAVKRRRR
jgi:hypothetical protein